MKCKLIFAVFMLAFSMPSQAERIKDIANVQGVRNNQLIGYGLVVGLPGTGEKTNYTEQTFTTMLKNFGINLPENFRPKIKNVAVVAVHADMPAFIKPGQELDVTVSSLGEAKSLRGGTLLQTFLKGVDGNVYAIAQGSLVVSGFSADGLDGSKVIQNTPTVGRIPNGAIVERSVATPFSTGDYLTFNLRRSDFSTAQRMADAINDLLGPDMARPLDATSIQVSAPRDVSQRVSFLATLENIEVEPAEESAKVIVNSRTGTIVVGQNVKLLPAAVTHGGLTVTIAEATQVSQPNALANGQTTVTSNSTINATESDRRMFMFNPGTTLDELVRAVNLVGAAPSDVLAILEALKVAGALHGELIII
ncbi:flagellar basal body P-ring protein FlgI [Shewanella oneidensis MR-1]|uniref:Flagellar P-ring protein n=1 Tax=Shewanella oneidensis (strain ATCC 700550 / JCM 31522 / CIP 106686 / LMG 19005 / NCIMB 14063 / MR-1) TaxID=211586 RepID=FLGI_SHEON|nr:flagellar basal body P-ring protein FlgI [Shewanella oneidensis]Q8ECA2.1 RecName: Full=Flagellar P-ring protein; AltName: Full=Basal body P-ring protein; Flags: Precursor [Shewanella oneidensis MR-1]AAN56240.1 flagellar P-ring protein FlgI [Shewanella oneidensis MR-1]MDX5999328.1 flagellar basal body P-ring protein FlgI [Shewanella oneidensis]MEE2026376.1 Flagellar P-ring protein [Shewanella oneidensis]QKG97664.1 flagellar basal body P-ring protein FlgI [Shewanella oneidensis MR-1]